MTRPQKQQEQSMILEMREGFNIFLFAADAHAMCFLPFTRSGMGTRGIGAPGFWAMLLIALYAGKTHSTDMLAYWYVWLALVIYRRVTADKRQHSRFQGWVWAFDWLIRNELMARRLEALSMLLIGHLLTAWSPPAGQFVFYGFYSLGFKCAIEAMVENRHREAAHNARVEMEAMQRRFQEQRRSW